MQPVYLICGVPGVGKSWVCRQAGPKFNYLCYDVLYKTGKHTDEVIRAARDGKKPILTECPFGERALRTALETMRITVHPYFVIESPDVVIARYRQREGRRPAQNIITRASSIAFRAREWNAPGGSAQEILNMLRTLQVPLPAPL